MRDCEAFFDEPARRAGVVLNTRVAKGHRGLFASRSALRRIVINLVSNALKFTPPGGVITVDAQDRDDRVRLVVSDTGKGIDARDLARVGNPFFQVRNEDRSPNRGSGLGLAIVRELVSEHGGSFRIDSVLGEGTSVTIELPIGGGDGKDLNAPGTKGPLPAHAIAARQEGELTHGQSKTA